MTDISREAKLLATYIIDSSGKRIRNRRLLPRSSSDISREAMERLFDKERNGCSVYGRCQREAWLEFAEALRDRLDEAERDLRALGMFGGEEV